MSWQTQPHPFCSHEPVKKLVMGRFYQWRCSCGRIVAGPTSPGSLPRVARGKKTMAELDEQRAIDRAQGKAMELQS